MKTVKELVLSGLFSLILTQTAWAGVQEVASEAGIAQTTRTFSVNPADFNSDGIEDLFLVRHDPDDLGERIPPSTLYRGTGSGYSAFASEAFGRSDKHGCAWGDANVDGRPDMFCAVGLTQFSKNELWIQNADGSFTNRAQALGLTAGTHGRYRYATFIDADADGRPDIYVARYTGSCFCGTYPGDDFPNELWINEGATFRNAPEFGLNKPIGAKKDNATCAQAVDYDGDGDQDLLVCAAKGPRLYRNNSGTGFTDVTAAKKIGGNANDARLVDLNGDGNLDYAKLTATDFTIRNGTSEGTWGTVSFTETVTSGEALAFGRFDPGATVDIYALSSRGSDKIDDPDMILLNQGNGRYVKNTIPATSGSGDDVASLDPTQAGGVDFVVTNGDRKIAGPVQLFTWGR